MNDNEILPQKKDQGGFDTLGCGPVTDQEHRGCWDRGCKDSEVQGPGHMALTSWFFLWAADCSISPSTSKKEKHQKYKP